MKALIDTCVILDVLTKREPFYSNSKRIIEYVAKNKIIGYVTSCSIRDIDYLIHKYNHSYEQTKTTICSIIELFNILDVSKEDVINALHSNINDFEDAVLVETVRRHDIGTIITRNIDDFKNAPVQVLSPQEI